MHASDSASESAPARPGGAPVALVTGGAIRVGRAVCLALADAGYDVALTYRRSAGPAEQVVEELRTRGRRALAIAADFEQDDAAESTAAAVREAFGRCDALINSAASFDPSPLAELDREALRRQIRVNAESPIMLIRELAADLGARYEPDEPASPGRVVNFIDIHVMGQPLKGYLAYNASKAMLQEATRTAALELAPRVTVNAIAPGVVAWAESYTPEQRRQYMKRVPLDRPGTPDDAAAAVRFLVTQAHYCTAQTIRLDGGRLYT